MTVSSILSRANNHQTININEKECKNTMWNSDSELEVYILLSQRNVYIFLLWLSSDWRSEKNIFHMQRV